MQQQQEQRHVQLIWAFERREKVAVFGVCVLCMPAFDVVVASRGTDHARGPMVAVGQWSLKCLRILLEHLRIDDTYIEAFAPMLRSSELAKEEQSSVGLRLWSFVDVIPRAHRKQIVVELAIVVLFAGGYDARARSTLRRLCVVFKLSWEYFACVEKTVGKSLLGASSISHTYSQKQNKMSRYAKIGVAAVGAGALLAVTGGLAAPLIAAGIAAIGTTGTATLAALATTTTVTTIFGTTGAGLAGYKMTRRTAGLREFEFERHKGEGSLAVCICVGGWLEDAEDYKRAFGIVPEKMSLQERLTRFYRVHSPELVEQAPVQAAEAKRNGSEENLLRTLGDAYGADPYDPKSLQPNAENWMERSALPVEDSERISQVVEAIALALARTRPSSTEDELASGSAPLAAEVSQNEQTDSTLQDERAKLEETVEEMFSRQQETHGSSPRRAELTADHGLLLDEDEALKQREQEQKRATEQLVSRSEDTVQDTIFEEHMKFWAWEELPGSEQYELYTVRWETALLMQLGRSISSLLRSASEQVTKTALETTVFASLVTALAWPYALLKLADGIDNVWTLSCERADEAGRVMAAVLRKRPQGARPVTLVGYSTGARVVFSCLEELHRLSCEADEGTQDSTSDGCADSTRDTEVTPEEGKQFTEQRSSRWKLWRGKSKRQVLTEDCYGIVDDVILLGTPVDVDASRWARVRQVVGGRLVNGYTSNDLVLALIYRYERWAMRVAGTMEVKVDGVENWDLSELVSSHTDYIDNMQAILSMVRFDTNEMHKFI